MFKKCLNDIKERPVICLSLSEMSSDLIMIYMNDSENELP